MICHTELFKQESLWRVEGVTVVVLLPKISEGEGSLGSHMYPSLGNFS